MFCSMSNYSQILEENWKHVLNEYYQKGLIQEKGLSGLFQKSSPKQTKQTHKEFDKQDKTQRTGNVTSKRKRLAATAFDVAHGLVRMYSGDENPWNFQKTDGSYLQRPKNHLAETENLRTKIVNIITNILTLIYTINAIGYFNVSQRRRKVDPHRTKLANKQLTYMFKYQEPNKLYTLPSNLDAKQMQVALSQCLNTKQNRIFKGFEWCQKVAKECVLNSVEINYGQVKTLINNSLKKQLDIIDKNMNEYIVGLDRGDKSLKGNDFILSQIGKKEQIAEMALKQVLQLLQNQLKLMVSVPSGLSKQNLIDYIFNMKALNQFITNQIKNAQAQFNKKVENSYY